MNYGNFLLSIRHLCIYLRVYVCMYTCMYLGIGLAKKSVRVFLLLQCYGKAGTNFLAKPIWIVSLNAFI